MEIVRFQIPGAPRTKKNHSRVVRCGKHIKLLPSLAHEAWFNTAFIALRSNVACMNGLPIDKPVNAKALFYRDALTGDAVGYYQALGDLLQAAGVVTDDKYIVSWNGSQLLKDAKDPRIEVTIEVL